MRWRTTALACGVACCTSGTQETQVADDASNSAPRSDGGTEEAEADADTRSVPAIRHPAPSSPMTPRSEPSLADGDHVFRRIGHRAVQMGGTTDSPARVQPYYSLAAFPHGEVVALNYYESPQLFRFYPEAGALALQAIHAEPRLGNEDNGRPVLRAHKGDSAETSFTFWTVDGYEEIVEENGSHRRDSAVFLGRPVEVSPGRLQVSDARALNFATDPDISAGEAGLDYDSLHRLVFVPISFGNNPDRDDILQIFHLDATDGRLEDRVQVWEPDPSDTRQRFSFVRASPEHRLVLLSAGNTWQPQEDILYLVEYQPTSEGSEGAVAVTRVERTGDLTVLGETGSRFHLQAAQDAAFVERDGRVLAIVAGNIHERHRTDPDQHAFGLYLFDLGSAELGYRLQPPLALLRFEHPIETVRRHRDSLLVSSRGLHVIAIEDIATARGLAPARFRYQVPLPYETYDLDLTTLEDRTFLFLAAGEHGIDIFELLHHGDADRTLPHVDAVSTSLGDRTGSLLIETGDSIRHLGTPRVNDRGDLAAWAVTHDGFEAILLRRYEGTWSWVQPPGEEGVAVVGWPSINEEGSIAFFVGTTGGDEWIRVWRDGETTDSFVSRSRLGVPELADSGQVLVHSMRNGRAELLLGHDDDSAVVMAADEGDFVILPEYDLGYDDSVIYIRRNYGTRTARLERSREGHAVQLLASEPEQNRVQAGTDGTVLRTWRDEISRLHYVGFDGSLRTLAQHRTDYHGHRFGNFGYGQMNKRGDTVFTAVSWGFGSFFDPSRIGDWLHLLPARSDDPSTTLVAPGMAWEGKSIAGVDFRDSFGNNRAVWCTVTAVGLEGNATQAVLRID